MIDIPIIYEDNHLLVVEKPVNILSQEDHTGDPDILSLLKEDIKIRYNKPGNVYLGLIHRLDRPVGGTMVFAKTSKSASRLSKEIRDRKFEKVYLAVLKGIPINKKDSLRHYLLKDNEYNRVFAVRKDTKGAKEAILDYEIIDTNENLSLVKINLHTGRPHQIRVQFASIGHPLYGDQRYGIRDGKNNIALWSYEISCTHPTLKERMTFKTYPPKVEPWKKFNIFKSKF
ncbi:MAG: RluA family pseudouridine synthase [Clostridiales bacterium]|nr:RluA family pseudouridine synthase [Clostridiales bacterium]